MPSAGIRRTTRVFGLVQGSDGARVLRSGRRLWPDRMNNEDDAVDCFKSIDEVLQADVAPQRDVCNVSDGLKSGTFDADENFDDLILREMGENCGDRKMYGIVYSRKRKRFRFQGGGDVNVSVDVSDDRMYGTYYVRKRKKERVANLPVCVENDEIWPRVVAVTYKGEPGNLHLLAAYLFSVLSYMLNNWVRLGDLTGFLTSQPMAMVFSAAGISLLMEPGTEEAKCCKIYYTSSRKPSFSVNFPSLPRCFMYMHSAMLLKSESRLLRLVEHPRFTNGNDVMLVDTKYKYLLDSSVLGAPATELFTIESPLSSFVGTGVQREVMHPRTLPRSTFRIFRKKRTSWRSKKAQNYSLLFSRRSSRGRSISDFITVSNKASRPFMFTKQFHRKPACIDVNKKELNLTKSGSSDKATLNYCLANVLVVETEKCYREEGAHIVLEQYPTNEWFLVVKQNRQIRCSHKAEKIMRPCSSNQVTHDIIWAVTDSLKLEFPCTSDWETFKELYKECTERNIAASTVKLIPIPCVTEVSTFGDKHRDLFVRPEAYIRYTGDEVSRALISRKSNYDMDSDDEEWLNKFNSVSHNKNLTAHYVSDETFELVINSLEKASYFMPVDLENQGVPANLCSDLCSREVLEAVHSYWINKRKMKRAVLVRVFQVDQPLKGLDDQDILLPKTKQPKRSAGHSMKAKQQCTKDNASKGLDGKVKTETAYTLVRQSMDLAVKKRRIAQLLMVNADMMMYKAIMSIKISEEVQSTGSSELADLTDSLGQHPSPSQCIG